VFRAPCIGHTDLLINDMAFFNTTADKKRPTTVFGALFVGYGAFFIGYRALFIDRAFLIEYSAFLTKDRALPTHHSSQWETNNRIWGFLVGYRAPLNGYAALLTYHCGQWETNNSSSLLQGAWRNSQE